MRDSSSRTRRLPGEPICGWMRAGVALVALGVAAIFAVALWINPYRESGQTMGTHQQLGLPPCSFLVVTGLPCPSCGLTTSFAYTARGDLANGARANWVGVLMAAGCLLLMPWGIASAVKGKALFVPSVEKLLVVSVLGLFVLLFVRWGIVVGMAWWTGSPSAGP